VTPFYDAVPLGDSAITLKFGTDKSAALLRQIHATAAHLRRQKLRHVEDIVPAYLAIAVFYDPLAASYEEMKDTLLGAMETREVAELAELPVQEHVIPVRYDGADLHDVAERCRLTVDDVVAIHSSGTYTVDLLGFVPGFAYLSEVDPRIQLPRRSEPRTRVPAGSVAIAGTHTGVYPLDTPGGWHVLGSTETPMFDVTREPPALLAAGDVVRFEGVR
jgi:inhibitor of KinA